MFGVPGPAGLGQHKCFRQKHGVEFVAHLGVAQHGGNNVCYQCFCAFLCNVSSSYLWWRLQAGVLGQAILQCHLEVVISFRVGSFKRQGQGLYCVSCVPPHTLPPTMFLLTLHSLCWPESCKPLTWWPKGKNHNSLADGRETHFFNWAAHKPASGDSLMTTITKLYRLQGIYVLSVPLNY